MSERWVELTKVILEMGGAREGFGFIVYIDKWSCQVTFFCLENYVVAFQ